MPTMVVLRPKGTHNPRFLQKELHLPALRTRRKNQIQNMANIIPFTTSNALAFLTLTQLNKTSKLNNLKNYLNPPPHQKPRMLSDRHTAPLTASSNNNDQPPATAPHRGYKQPSRQPENHPN